MKKTLIERLDEYRLENKITQTELGAMLGVHFATVNRWFNGVHEPKKIQAYHIEKLLKGRKR